MQPAGVTTTCELDTDHFLCAPIDQTLTVDGVDASLPSRLGITGTVSNTLQMCGTYAANVDCDGAACALAEATYQISFPCTALLRWCADHEDVGDTATP